MNWHDAVYIGIGAIIAFGIFAKTSFLDLAETQAEMGFLPAILLVFVCVTWPFLALLFLCWCIGTLIYKLMKYLKRNERQ